jgi:hypothetical protein
MRPGWQPPLGVWIAVALSAVCWVIAAVIVYRLVSR